MGWIQYHLEGRSGGVHEIALGKKGKMAAKVREEKSQKGKEWKRNFLSSESDDPRKKETKHGENHSCNKKRTSSRGYSCYMSQKVEWRDQQEKRDQRFNSLTDIIGVQHKGPRAFG